MDGKVTLKLLVDEDRLILYSTVIAFDKLGVDPMVLVNRLISLIPAENVYRRKEFEEMALAVIDAIDSEDDSSLDNVP